MKRASRNIDYVTEMNSNSVSLVLKSEQFFPFFFFFLYKNITIFFSFYNYILLEVQHQDLQIAYKPLNISFNDQVT
jgi:hypothetical protein